MIYQMLLTLCLYLITFFDRTSINVSPRKVNDRTNFRRKNITNENDRSNGNVIETKNKG